MCPYYLHMNMRSTRTPNRQSCQVSYKTNTCNELDRYDSSFHLLQHLRIIMAFEYIEVHLFPFVAAIRT